MLDAIPLWGLIFLTLALVLVSSEVGFRLGSRRYHDPHEHEAPVGALGAATLALLGFMLAFTFSIGAERFDARRRAVLEEANAIGTAYLRCTFLPEDQVQTCRDLFRRYTHIRIGAASTPEGLEQVVSESEQLQGKFWALVSENAKAAPQSEPASLLVQATNAVIDLHEERLTVGLRARIPSTIWITLYMLSVLASGAMGYHSGLSGNRRTPAMVPFALAFSMVFGLIADLDRPREGLLKVDERAMQDLERSMAGEKAEGARAGD